MGAEARFSPITGFAQISEKLLVVADSFHHCMRLIDRATNKTSVFSGQCESRGYEDGSPGQFNSPWSVAMDQIRDKNQLLITDRYNKALRTVDVKSQAVSTFVQSDSLDQLRSMTQEEKSGDLYVTAYHAVYRIMYIEKTVSLMSGSTGSNSGYKDSTLLNSLFYDPFEIIFITPKTLLVADAGNNKLRLVDMTSDKVTTLNVTSSLNEPTSLLLTNNALYVGQIKIITQCKCDYYSIFLT